MYIYKPGVVRLFKNEAFIENMYKECHYEMQIINKRLHDIELEVKETGTYTHTEEELIYGAKMAWRI